MKFIKVLTFVFLFASIISAQENPNMDAAKYNSLRDSLENKRTLLLSEKILLKTEIDSLYSQSAKLDEQLKEVSYDVFVKKYGSEIGKRVYHGQIWKGMTEQMMLDGWGKPDKRETNKEKWGVFTQFYYGEITYFFKNGQLTDWEETKK
ncbi:MAG: hypothetical protein JEY94_06435 [Melioribacteraceae bacterium]|nr:hypothetical protein [Melioribacteraceae bacterium]